MTTNTPRLASIDVFRAITMLLMIFVNDLWTLRDIPQWLEHTAAHDDGMGLADTVFPAFLFIVGLSIPLAIGGRMKKGASTGSIVWYIVTRTLALLIMGFFHVNSESYHREAALLPKAVWIIALTTSFFLIWLDYPAQLSKPKRYMLQGLGIALLLFLAIVYKGKDDGETVWMKPHWWGILGLIGWAYLLSALVYLFARGRLTILIGVWIIFMVLNVIETAGWWQGIGKIGGSSGVALNLAGMVTTTIYTQLTARSKQNQYYLAILLLAALLLATGCILRPYWGISKILATPSWVMICSGISMLFFLLLTWLVDRHNRSNWFAIIRPAGTSTLTAYLLPYYAYSIVGLIGIGLPAVLLTGIVGIVKSILFALLIVVITGLLEKRRLRLKI